MKKVLLLLFVIVLVSCSRKQSVENKTEANNTEKNQAELVITTPERTYLTMDEYLEEHFKSYGYGKGGISIYNEGLIYDVPESVKREEFRVFGIEGDYIPPETPYKEIEISFRPGIDSLLHVMLPKEVYDKNPEVYIEAQHEGKSFFYNNKLPLNLKEIVSYSDTIIGYEHALIFNNRNLYSKDYNWDVLLRNCSTDEILYKQSFTLGFGPQEYVVYSQEFENPFVRLENDNLETGKQYHLIYQGKGSSSSDNNGTMAIFSYGYQPRNIVYFPLFGVITKTDKNGVCHFEFSIKERGQYKIDFYNTATGEIIRNDAFHYIQASGKDIKHVEKKGTNWKVNSADGLRLRNSPWGEKIGLLENETLLVQTEETLYPFYDFIDDQHGFWIPVKIENKPEDYNSDYKEKLICDYPDETDGWVFSGFLKKMD